jgi:hypothetical protein
VKRRWKKIKSKNHPSARHSHQTVVYRVRAIIYSYNLFEILMTAIFSEQNDFVWRDFRRQNDERFVVIRFR